MRKILANDAIEQVVVGPLEFEKLEVGSSYEFQPRRVPLADLDDAALMRLSRQGQLYLSLDEMRTIQAHFRGQSREPTDVELETIAQTWSEHCSHKTLAGASRYRDEAGRSGVSTTCSRRRSSPPRPRSAARWARTTGASASSRTTPASSASTTSTTSCFKVETHNHPSALEPYGGANTGLGGVIRDPLGTGLGAKPICNTDVFCFAPPDTPAGSLAARRAASPSA